jgi:hypothetical protein
LPAAVYSESSNIGLVVLDLNNFKNLLLYKNSVGESKFTRESRGSGPRGHGYVRI